MNVRLTRNLSKTLLNKNVLSVGFGQLFLIINLAVINGEKAQSTKTHYGSSTH